ncbi:MAG TPA: metal-dependent hydrolase [Chitinophagaceae bacterium]|nr:metal-dependent hydrolase [Chitinophagaceae bacterium]
MFIGHFAVGLASRRIDRAPSLAMMFIAVQLLDLIWPILVLLGIETLQVDVGNTRMTPLDFNYYPYSHSLLMAVVWGILLGLLYYLTTKNKKGSILLSLLVVSHWILDFLTHRPDLPLSPFNDQKFGLGLWNHPVLESVIEIGLFLLGTIWYYQSVKPVRKIAFWSLIGFFLFSHIMNLLGPPPPSGEMVAWAAMAMWIFVFWAWWVEKK